MQVVQTKGSITTQEFESSISSKGQVMIPLALRKKLGVKAKDKIVFHVEADEIRLAPAHSSLEDVYQSVAPLKTPKTLAEMRKIYQEERAKETVREGV